MAINAADNATHQGDDSPKNNAISLPDENPAPIDVPMNKNATLKAVSIRNFMTRDIKYDYGRARDLPCNA